MRSSATLGAAALTAVMLLAQPAAAQHHAGHGGHGAHGAHAAPRGKSKAARTPSTPATQEFKAAHHKMMQDMDQPYTGDPDVDFRIQMIPHHQGAIDMARVALRHAKSPWTRQLAESVILEQQREIAEMQAWLAQRGIAAARTEGPQYLVRSSSFPRREETPGTLNEARGQSWAPSSGIR